MIPIIPLSYDFGAEIAYPVSEATVGGTELVIAQIWGSIDVSIYRYEDEIYMHYFIVFHC